MSSDIVYYYQFTVAPVAYNSSAMEIGGNDSQYILLQLKFIFCNLFHLLHVCTTTCYVNIYFTDTIYFKWWIKKMN